MESRKYTCEYRSEVVDFLVGAGLSDLDSEILENLTYLVNENEIVATMAFDKKSNEGFLRYFVISEKADYEVIKNLIDDIETDARNKGIFELKLLLKSEEISELLSCFGFIKRKENGIKYLQKKVK